MLPFSSRTTEFSSSVGATDGAGPPSSGVAPYHFTPPSFSRTSQK